MHCRRIDGHHHGRKIVGAFLAGTVLEADWFGQAPMDRLRHHVLLILMPVFFLSTGLRTEWALGGIAVLVAALVLMATFSTMLTIPMVTSRGGRCAWHA